MMDVLGAVALSYLAGSGTVTNCAVIGRGLFRSACHAVEGHWREAGVEALGGIAAPALMSYGATAELVLDAVEAARSLAGPALEAAGESLHDRSAA
jgi:hypothetical protein